LISGGANSKFAGEAFLLRLPMRCMIEKRRRRRANGSISVVWRVRWHDETGAERNKTFDRVADARVFEAKVRTLKRMGDLAELDAAPRPSRSSGTSGGPCTRSRYLERSTQELYARMWRVHVEARLGARRLRDLTPQAIARFRAELEAAEVGPEAVRKTLTMLQGALQRAVKWQRIRSNPVRLTRKPPAGRRHAVRAMTPRVIETMRFRLVERGLRRDAILVALLGYAGLRPEEALGLQWRHIGERVIVVEHAVSDGRLKALKNRSQPRAVELLRPLRDDLFSWRGLRARANESQLLFPRSDGGLWLASDWRNWRRRIYAPAASAGVDGARPYDLRHSFASLLIEEGRLSVVEIAAQLGHRPTVCLDTYAHVMGDTEARRVGAPSNASSPRGRRSRPAWIRPETDSNRPESGPLDSRMGEQPQALCRTRSGDHFLTMAVRLGLASSRGRPKHLQRC
jgi:integrase